MGAEAAATVVLEGAEFRWELGLIWWEFAGDSSLDGDWISAEVALVAGTRNAFSGRATTQVLAGELKDFRDSLGALLETKAGTATFAPLESDTGVTITANPDFDLGYEVDVFVRQRPWPHLVAREVWSSERELQAALHALGDAVAQFPIDGGPEGRAA